jgi:seryl-tRNA synthetase
MVKKKTVNYFAYVPVITIAVGLIASWAKFQAMAEDTRTKIEKLTENVKEISEETTEDTKELKEDNRALEKKVEVNKTQQDNIQAQVQQVSEKTDKIYDLLIEMERKKK